MFNKISTSKALKMSTNTELKELLDNRFINKSEFFETNQLIVSYYKFVKNIVDYYNESSI